MEELKGGFDMRANRGQAAMEFLMTYGWAILAAIIAIGVLAYFGVFNSENFSPGATVVQQPFYAVGAAVTSTSIQVEVKNNGGETYNVTSFSVTPDTGSCTDSTSSTVLTAGQSSVLSVTCTGLTSGNNMRGDIVITYRRSGSSLDLRSVGTIAERVA